MSDLQSLLWQHSRDLLNIPISVSVFQQHESDDLGVSGGVILTNARNKINDLHKVSPGRGEASAVCVSTAQNYRDPERCE